MINLLRTSPEISASQARIREADADAARAHATRMQQLEYQRQVDAEAERRQARETKATRRAEREQRNARRAQARRAALRSFRVQLPARLILVPVCLAVAAAWKGQKDWATTGLHWPLLWAAGLATALETLGLSLGAMARVARNDGDSAIVERTLMWSVVFSAAWLNWHNSHEPVLGLMSVAGVAGWEVYERRRNRHLRACERPARRPAFGVARWLRFPAWTFTAWSVSIRDRMGPEAAAAALERARVERGQRRAFGWRNRRRMPRLVRRAIESSRSALLVRAEAILGEAEATIGAAALLLGTEEIRRTAAALEDGRGVTGAEAGAAGAEGGRPRRRRLLGRRRQVAGGEPAAVAGNVTGHPAGLAEDVTEGLAGHTEDVAETPRPAIPKPVRRSRPKTRAASGRQAGPATRPATPATDITDLLPVATEIAAELGDRLTRDQLITQLRARGLAVGGKRRDAIWRAVQPRQPHAASPAA